MRVRTLVDAGPLVGWLNADDQWHGWSVSVLSRARGPLHTSEIILGEACWNLGGNSSPSHALLTLVRKGAIQLLRPWPEQLERTQELMIKYESPVERMDRTHGNFCLRQGGWRCSFGK